MKTFIFLFLIALHVDASNINSLLFNGNCIACHEKNKNLSAPSVVEFKKVYKNAFKKEEDFVNYMSKWVANPNEKTSLMDKEVKKYGLMPHLSFDEDVLKDIAKYIYHTDFGVKN